jgi:hypothetical protein
MMAQLLCRLKRPAPGLMTSQLYNEQTFYRAFERDLACCRNEAVIESPFLTTRRIRTLLPMLRKMVARGVRVTINTKHPQEQEDYMCAEAEASIALLQDIGVEIRFTGGHHRKLAIFDRAILWEGSLNALSQNDSCEVMRRMESEDLAKQMLDFTGLTKFLRD